MITTEMKFQLEAPYDSDDLGRLFDALVDMEQVFDELLDAGMGVDYATGILEVEMTLDMESPVDALVQSRLVMEQAVERVGGQLEAYYKQQREVSVKSESVRPELLAKTA